MPEHWENPDDAAYDTCPNYCRDLNAVHEAEKKLDHNQHKTFRLRLMEQAFTVGVNGKLNADRMYQSSEARQRAEALVKVIESTK